MVSPHRLAAFRHRSELWELLEEWIKEPGSQNTFMKGGEQ